MRIGPLQGRNVRTWEAAWPLDIRDGEPAYARGVFVDGPEGDPPAALEERAKRAAAAWLLKIGTADLPAEKESDQNAEK